MKSEKELRIWRKTCCKKNMSVIIIKMLETSHTEYKHMRINLYVYMYVYKYMYYGCIYV